MKLKVLAIWGEGGGYLSKKFWVGNVPLALQNSQPIPLLVQADFATLNKICWVRQGKH